MGAVFYPRHVTIWKWGPDGIILPVVTHRFVEPNIRFDRIVTFRSGPTYGYVCMSLQGSLTSLICEESPAPLVTLR